jgi:NAD+ synthase (glutamine-hydrolysing)
MALCGYPPEDLLLRPAFHKHCERHLKDIVKKSKGLTAAVGFPHLSKNGRYNAAAIIQDGKWVKTYHKVELPNYGVFDEKRYFRPGRSPLFFKCAGLKVGVTICEDLWIRNGVVEKSVKKNRPDIVINLSASPFDAGKWSLRRDIVTGFAGRTKRPLFYTNIAGGQDELVFDGGSMICDKKGEIIGMAKRFEEDMVTADVPEKGAVSVTVGNKEQSVDPVQEIYAALVLGTRDYARKNGFKKATIGLSGGIDSSLVAAVAVHALGKENVIGVTMPSRYSSESTRSDAEQLARNLGIEFKTIPIQDIFSTSLKSIFGEKGEGEQGVAVENLQARIRGNILMTLSNKYGCIILSPGNKSEMSVGYATLYGDMCGGYAVIKDVPKTMVFKLSMYVNKRAGKEIIPQSVMERPPSAELKSGQTDQDSLPAYEVLDPILKSYIEDDLSPTEIISRGVDADLVRDVVRMVNKSEFKRRQAPPGVKITPKAFGRDRRMPISNKYRP